MDAHGIAFRHQADHENPTEKDLLRNGRELIAAGYCMYGK